MQSQHGEASGLAPEVVHTVAITTPARWFDDRRGLATGLVGFAYAGASFLIVPLARGRVTADIVETMLGLAAIVDVTTLVGIPFLRS
ncbi:hypothetical protein GCM10008995_13540 [Halobellus salinus]|uniref:Uncharacterized protein n=1 Tax=Halobellus salinus TaxID=931585 RepID=A0A830EN41_9EURY|nr:hypothetical protein [Halobellus salinus]GGJ04969.1 hypothetical protein GCM10008995_13540 [Halobellus salinus]